VTYYPWRIEYFGAVAPGIADSTGAAIPTSSPVTAPDPVSGAVVTPQPKGVVPVIAVGHSHTTNSDQTGIVALTLFGVVLLLVTGVTTYARRRRTLSS
jgi:uncharacterized iron-regulated membrane protein